MLGRSRRWWLGAALLAAGCSQGIGDRDAGTWNGVGSGASGADGADGGDDGSADDGADDGDQAGDDGADDGVDDGVDDGGTKLDVPSGDSGVADDGASSEGCDKLDLLVAIDGSISMDVAQDKLGTSIESFVGAIESQLVDLADYHIGVITSTDYPYNAGGCTAPGSLIEKTGGQGSSNTQCGPFAGGGAWLSSADLDVGNEFRCIAGIGLGNGNVELTAQSIIDAITDDGPGGCNAGFVRDDALLVIVNITDTDDPSSYPVGLGSTGDPDAWFQSIVAVKGGIETNVVMISIIPPANPSCTVEGNWSPLLPGQLDAPRLDSLTTKFTHHYVGDICAPDYGVLLSEALSEIEAGCDDFDPPG